MIKIIDQASYSLPDQYIQLNICILLNENSTLMGNSEENIAKKIVGQKDQSFGK